MSSFIPQWGLSKSKPLFIKHKNGKVEDCPRIVNKKLHEAEMKIYWDKYHKQREEKAHTCYHLPPVEVKR